MAKGILLLGILCCTAGIANCKPIMDTYEYTLENGLKIIVREDHRAPLVVTQIWYKVGGSYENDGSYGISHALEHMMFRGTEAYPAGYFSKIIAEHGGQQNAFTGYDYTSYFQKIDAAQLELCLAMEADRMQNLLLSEEEFSKEIKVVAEERRLRIEDSPEARTRELFFAAAYVNNPRQHPLIGWMSDINTLTVDDLRSWYKTWYVPNNAILVVVGDVNPQTVFDLAEKYFGPIPAKTVPTLKPRQSPPYVGPKHVDVILQTDVPRLMLGYNVPVLKTVEDSNEPYALLVLLMALDGGSSARLSENVLRGKALAANISSAYNPFQLFSGQFTISASPSEGHSLDELKQELLVQIKHLQEELLKDEELERIKTNALAEYLYKQDSAIQQANELGILESVGFSWQLSDHYVDELQKITAEQVREVAKKYLVSERQTTAYLMPSLEKTKK
jgi:zinc protease